jgi:hypothetical protein
MVAHPTSDGRPVPRCRIGIADGRCARRQRQSSWWPCRHAMLPLPMPRYRPPIEDDLPISAAARRSLNLLVILGHSPVSAPRDIAAREPGPRRMLPQGRAEQYAPCDVRKGGLPSLQGQELTRCNSNTFSSQPEAGPLTRGAAGTAAASNGRILPTDSTYASFSSASAPGPAKRSSSRGPVDLSSSPGAPSLEWPGIL